MSGAAAGGAAAGSSSAAAQPSPGALAAAASAGSCGASAWGAAGLRAARGPSHAARELAQVACKRHRSLKDRSAPCEPKAAGRLASRGLPTGARKQAALVTCLTGPRHVAAPRTSRPPSLQQAARMCAARSSRRCERPGLARRGSSHPPACTRPCLLRLLRAGSRSARRCGRHSLALPQRSGRAASPARHPSRPACCPGCGSQRAQCDRLNPGSCAKCQVICATHPT